MPKNIEIGKGAACFIINFNIQENDAHFTTFEKDGFFIYEYSYPGFTFTSKKQLLDFKTNKVVLRDRAVFAVKEADEKAMLYKVEF